MCSCASCLVPYTFPGMGKHLPRRNSGSSTHVMLLFEVEDLKNPVAHDAHFGCLVVEPLTLVYLPGGHLVWAVQLPVDVEALKNPNAHCAQDCALFLSLCAYVPGGQSVEVAAEIWEIRTATSNSRCNSISIRVVKKKKMQFR